MTSASGLADRVAPLHRALAHEISRLTDAVPAVAAGDGATSRSLGTWAFDVADGLHHYLRALEAWVRPVVQAHEGSDEFAADVLRAVARDQTGLEASTQRAMGAAVRWQDGASTADRDALAVHLGRLRSGTAVAFPRIEGDLASLADRLVDEDVVASVARHPAAALGGRRGRALTGAVLAVAGGATAVPGAGGPAGAAANPATGPSLGPVARLRRAAARREYRRRTAALAGRLP